MYNEGLGQTSGSQVLAEWCKNQGVLQCTIQEVVKVGLRACYVLPKLWERGMGGQVGPRPGESSLVCPGREVALDV